MPVELQIDAPLGAVFDAMADARNEPNWNTQVSETELLTGESIGRGSQFRTVNRGRTYTATITEHDRPNHVTFLVSGKSMDITGALTFADLDGSTRMTGTFDLQPKGFMKVMLPVMAGAVRKDFPGRCPASRSSVNHDGSRSGERIVPRPSPAHPVSGTVTVTLSTITVAWERGRDMSPGM